jgi:hypothetical protein
MMILYNILINGMEVSSCTDGEKMMLARLPDYTSREDEWHGKQK